MRERVRPGVEAEVHLSASGSWRGKREMEREREREREGGRKKERDGGRERERRAQMLAAVEAVTSVAWWQLALFNAGAFGGGDLCMCVCVSVGR